MRSIVEESHIILLVIVAVVLFFTAIIFHFKRQYDRRLDLWRSLADAHGGAVKSEPRINDGGSKERFLSAAQLVLPIDGYSVRLDLFSVKKGQSTFTYQRASVATPVGWNKSAEIYKETPIFSAVDPEWIRAVLSRSTRLAHLASPEHGLSLSARSLPASGAAPPMPSTPEEIEQAISEATRDRRHDGLLCLSCLHTTDDPDKILTQMRLTVAYARDLLGT